MRILFITESFPYPLDTGGNVRTYHLLRGLARAHDVTLLSTDAGNVGEESVAHLRSLCSAVHVVHAERIGLLKELRALVGSVVSGVPFIIGRRYHPRLHEAARRLLGGASPTGSAPDGEELRTFDCVYLNHLDSVLYAPPTGQGPSIVLDEHNVVANQVLTTAQAEHRLLRRWVLRRDYGKLVRFEPEQVDAVDRCFVCSDADADHLRALGSRRTISVVPNGVDTDYFTPAAGGLAGRKDLIFVGTMDYDPCERGVWNFMTTVLPLLHRKAPELTFTVVGRNPSARLLESASRDARIRFTGRVNDVRPYLEGARVCVVPFLSGSGTRLKILEAMASGTPVVSTTIGAEGIEAVAGRELLIADSAEDFSRAVLRLLDDDALAEALQSAGRALVERLYSWNSIHQKLLSGLSIPAAGAGAAGG